MWTKSSKDCKMQIKFKKMKNQKFLVSKWLQVNSSTTLNFKRCLN